MAQIRFTKMQGIGNDYIYINCFREKIENPSALARKMSDRHFSVGADGMILICPSSVADARMRMFNADGSEGKMCGNGIRCVAKFLYDNGLVCKDRITVETLSGIKSVSVTVSHGKAILLSVDMGVADFSVSGVPMIASTDTFVSSPLLVGNRKYLVTALSVGNPHAVVFCEDAESVDLQTVGPLFEKHPAFPQSVNTEFVKVISPTELSMRVWERGSGETLACGTGACAVCAAAVKNGICPPDTEITVHLAGGNLAVIGTADGHLMMRGPAETVFEGIYETKSFEDGQ